MTSGSGCAHRSFARLRADLRSDVDRYLAAAMGEDAERAGRLTRLSVALAPPVLALALHRTAHWLFARGFRRLPAAIARLDLLLHKVDIAPSACLGRGAYLPHPVGVVLRGRAGDGLAVFSYGLVLDPAAPFADDAERGPALGDDVLVGVHAGVLGRVAVGTGAKVAFRAHVHGDLPGGSVVTSAHLRPRTTSRDVPATPDGASTGESPP